MQSVTLLAQVAQQIALQSLEDDTIILLKIRLYKNAKEVIDILFLTSIMRLVQLLLDLLVSLYVLADDLRVHLKGQLGLFGGLMQEAVDKNEDKPFHVLFLSLFL